MTQRALLLYGGWEGHQPERCADYAERSLLEEFEVTRSKDLGMLQPDALSQFDLVVPIWTFGELSQDREEALLQSVASGLGLVSWHGFASAFLESRPHKFLLGGQFVGHPGGNHVTYAVRFLANDPLVDGLEDFTISSEQYYLLIDPGVKVVAATSIVGDKMEWLSGVAMPLAWKRPWGMGRVFYCALGHALEDLQHPSVITMLRRAVRWAARGAPQ